MTNPVIEAKARAQAAIHDWRNARRSVNDPTSVPARLDDIVAIAEHAIAKIDQDIITEIEAIIVELTALQFPIDPEESLGALERATFALDGALGRIVRAASRAGFSEGDDDLGLPPGVRVPAAEIAEQLEAFVVAIEGVNKILDKISDTQTSDRNSSSKQSAMIQNVIDKASVKIEIIGMKAGRVSLVDVSGITILSRQLTQLLRSFAAAVGEAGERVSQWLSKDLPGWIEPAIISIAQQTSSLVRRASSWIRTRSGQKRNHAAPLDIHSEEGQGTQGFDLIEVERMIERGEIPPSDVVPFLTFFESYDLNQRAISVLGQMTGLRKLVVGSSEIEDIAPLAGLKSLQYLMIDGNALKDLSPLAELKLLQTLSLYSTDIADIAPLAGLSKLKHLTLTHSNVSNLSPLGKLSALETLTLGYSPIEHLNGIGSLSALQNLDLSNTKVSDLSPLSALMSLRSLSFDSTLVSDLSPVANLVRLHTLSFDRTRVATLSPIIKVRSLKSLSFDHTQVSDLSPLANHVELVSLSLNSTQITDLTPISNLTELKYLNLGGMQIDDLSPIKGLHAIEDLIISGTKVSDLSVVQNFSKLQSIHVERTPIRTLLPLRNLSNLEYIWIRKPDSEELISALQLKGVWEHDYRYRILRK